MDRDLCAMILRTCTVREVGDEVGVCDRHVLDDRAKAPIGGRGQIIAPRERRDRLTIGELPLGFEVLALGGVALGDVRDGGVLDAVARRLAASRAGKEARRSKRLWAFPGTVGLAPGADFAADVVQAARGVLVAACVHVAQVPGQAKQKAQFF